MKKIKSELMQTERVILYRYKVSLFFVGFMGKSELKKIKWFPKIVLKIPVLRKLNIN